MSSSNGESPRLRTTRDYSKFVNVKRNRPTNLDEHRKLGESMKSLGFLAAFPLFVIERNGKLELRDGQHRLAWAQKLGIPVWYVVLKTDVDIAALNNTQVTWKPLHYALSFASQGMPDYQELLVFCGRHGVRPLLGARLLSGSTCGSNVKKTFIEGTWKIKSREQAEKVVTIYSSLARLNKAMKNTQLVEAIVACCYVPGFDPKRLLEGASRIPEKLKAYGSRDGFLDMIEELYNFGRRQRVPLKIPAENAMRSRNPVNR